MKSSVLCFDNGKILQDNSFCIGKDIRCRKAVVSMEKRILTYRHFMDELIKEIMEKHDKSKEELELIRQEHLTQVSFFQHERLIHLIVTVTFALMEMLSLLMTLINADLFALLLTVVVLILLIPYIRHYYILENEVQKMYKQYDAICKELYDGKFYDSTAQAPTTRRQ